MNQYILYDNGENFNSKLLLQNNSNLRAEHASISFVGDSLSVLQNTSFVKNYDRSANLDVSIYKTGSSKSISRQYELAANAQLRLVVDEEVERFLDGKTGWMTVKADNPFVSSWYFEFNQSGVMGGDHGF